MEIKIEKNIPIPEDAGTGGRPSKYPWEQMEVGDSFFVPSEEGRPNIVGYANQRYQPAKFSSLIVETEGVRGMRVWRVE